MRVSSSSAWKPRAKDSTLSIMRLHCRAAGPEHAYLKETGRARYVAVSDSDAVAGFELLARLEGIIPALETAHAVAWIDAQRGSWKPDAQVLLCVSGRGDKDVAHVSAATGASV